MLNNKVTSTICQGIHSNATLSVKHLLYFVSKMYNNNNPPNGGICAYFLPGPRYLESFQCSMPKNAINIFTLVILYLSLDLVLARIEGLLTSCDLPPTIWLIYMWKLREQKKSDESWEEGEWGSYKQNPFYKWFCVWSQVGKEVGTVGEDEISSLWAPGGTTVFSPDYRIPVQKSKFCKKG